MGALQNTSFPIYFARHLESSPTGRGLLDLIAEAHETQATETPPEKEFNSQEEFLIAQEELFHEDSLSMLLLPGHTVAAGRLLNPITEEIDYIIFDPNEGEIRYSLDEREAFQARLADIVYSYQNQDTFILALLTRPAEELLWHHNQAKASGEETSHYQIMAKLNAAPASTEAQEMLELTEAKETCGREALAKYDSEAEDSQASEAEDFSDDDDEAWGLERHPAFPHCSIST